MQRRQPITRLPYSIYILTDSYLSLHLLEDSSDRKDRTVSRTGNNDTCLGSRRMYQLPITCIDSHMAGITYDVARLCILDTIYRCPHVSVRCGRMRQAYPKVIINAHHESGAVCTVGQTGATVYVRISYKLHCKLNNIGSRAAGRTLIRLTAIRSGRRGRRFG